MLARQVQLQTTYERLVFDARGLTEARVMRETERERLREREREREKRETDRERERERER